MVDSSLDEVRRACRKVADEALHVSIRRERLPEYAATLQLAQALHPEIDPERHYLGHGEETVAFFLTLNAINFGSGYFHELGLQSGQSGYFVIAAALTERFRRRGAFSASELRHLTGAGCLGIFGQDPQNEAAVELMELFAVAFNDLGEYLAAYFDGSATSLVEEAGGRAERLVALLAAMPMFQDVADYKGLTVPFYKRAQLTVADLTIAFHGEGWGRFTDLSCLTLFADNLVPHVLRQDGILDYHPQLAASIEAGLPIESGSAEEIELRACAVHAVEELAGELRDRGKPVTAMGLDQLLWNRGQKPEYRRLPRHRTKTIFY